MKHRSKVGLPPGTIKYTGKKGGIPLKLNYVEYDSTSFRKEIFEDVHKAKIYPANDKFIQWYDIRGLHDEALITKIGEAFEMHSLVVEDVADIYKRPEYSEYSNGHFITLKFIHFEEKGLQIQNVSIYFNKGYVLSFQEHEDDIFASLRERIETSLGRIRQKGADYLAYAIVDFIVDNYFHALDDIEVKIEDLEESLTTDPENFDRSAILPLKKDLLKIRKVIAPLREALNAFSKSESVSIEDRTKIYVRDVYDHTISIIDNLDSMRDILSGIQDLHLSEMSMKMNKVMQFLTVITAVFVPITFLAGIYGMNFVNIPELKLQNGYFILVGVMALLSVIMILYFKRKKWL